MRRARCRVLIRLSFSENPQGFRSKRCLGIGFQHLGPDGQKSYWDVLTKIKHGQCVFAGSCSSTRTACFPSPSHPGTRHISIGTCLF